MNLRILSVIISAITAYYLTKHNVKEDEILPIDDENTPKYKAGDPVVFVYRDANGTTYKEPCTVDDIVPCGTNEGFQYTLRERSEIVGEDELIPYTDVTVGDMASLPREHTPLGNYALEFVIEHDFTVGDEVCVDGYGDNVYIIEAICVDYMYDEDGPSMDVIFMLNGKHDGTYLEAVDVDLRTVSGHKPKKVADKPTEPKRSHRAKVDELLDDYNEFTALAEREEDTVIYRLYTEMAGDRLAELRRISGGKE